MEKKRKTMSWSDLIAVAAKASCDMRTVAAEVAEPGKVRNRARERARAAMRELKVGPFRERE